MKKTLIAVALLSFLCLNFTMAHQGPEGILISGAAYDALNGNIPYQEVTMPIVLMALHRGCDYYDGEYSFGDNRDEDIIINGIFSGIGYMLCGDEKARNKFIYCTFWGMFVPDVLLKQVLHGSENHIVDQTRGRQLMVSGLSLLSVKFVF